MLALIPTAQTADSQDSLERRKQKIKKQKSIDQGIFSFINTSVHLSPKLTESLQWR
jgi:hypothetical protein